MEVSYYPYFSCNILFVPNIFTLFWDLSFRYIELWFSYFNTIDCFISELAAVIYSLLLDI